MIEVSQVSKSFGSIAAVRDLSFVIQSGQCVGLLGPNGAGKSTTLRMITGYHPPTAGTVRVDGHDTITESIAARSVLGYLPESTPLYPEMRVVDFLKFRAGLYGLSGSAARTGIAKSMDLCRVSDVRTRRIGVLSKGYKQRVGLAAALVHDPRVLVLDEPTSGLDPTQIRETRSLIKDLAQKRTVLVSSHILPEIEQTCDRVLIMARGRLRADGSPAQLTAGGPGIYVIELAAAAPSLINSIRSRIMALEGVERVHEHTDVGGGFMRLVIDAAPGGHDLREALARAASNAADGGGGGVTVRELTRRTPTLEQVFVRIIESESENAGAHAA